MTSQQTVVNVTNLLESAPPKFAIALAKPWHYRRNGRYYLRLRTLGRPFGTFTVSLRTADRATAMEISHNIQRALAYFHLDKPEATWEELKARLLAITEECLAITHGNEGSDLTHSEIYREMYLALRQVSTQGELSVTQHRALVVGKSILSAANARIDGSSEALVGIIEQLNRDTAAHASPLQSVGPPQEPVYWASLRKDYIEEHRADLKQTSLEAVERVFNAIERTLMDVGITNLRDHTRSQLIAFRTALAETRKPITVNNILTQFRAVLHWAVQNDKLAKHYADDIKFKKGADSARVPLARDQVVALMSHAGALPETSWERWATSLLSITGARVGEVSGLTPDDVRQVDGFWCIDINEDTEGKSIKNKHSKRLVPLVDGALGFDLALFLQAVAAGSLPSSQGANTKQVTRKLGALIKQALGDSKGENQSLHSLRHHMASSMKAAGVEVQYAQGVTGHSSGTITYDAYGKGGIGVAQKHEAIKKALMGDLLRIEGASE